MDTRPHRPTRFGRATLYDLVLSRSEQAGLAARRGQLLAQARGRVLEIGAGTGLKKRQVCRGALTRAQARTRISLLKHMRG